VGLKPTSLHPTRHGPRPSGGGGGGLTRAAAQQGGQGNWAAA